MPDLPVLGSNVNANTPAVVSAATLELRFLNSLSSPQPTDDGASPSPYVTVAPISIALEISSSVALSLDMSIFLAKALCNLFAVYPTLPYPAS